MNKKLLKRFYAELGQMYYTLHNYIDAESFQEFSNINFVRQIKRMNNVRLNKVILLAKSFGVDRDQLNADIYDNLRYKFILNDAEIEIGTYDLKRKINIYSLLLKFNQHEIKELEKYFGLDSNNRLNFPSYILSISINPNVLCNTIMDSIRLHRNKESTSPNKFNVISGTKPSNTDWNANRKKYIDKANKLAIENIRKGNY